MSPSTVFGGQHYTKYVTFELLLHSFIHSLQLHAAFGADEIWGYMLEPARILYEVVILSFKTLTHQKKKKKVRRCVVYDTAVR